ncbi:hypothetical protein SEA_TARDUS_63 [Gordonia phage Tardus]|uniref:Uncharacterized protein n=1 Tax=Gordonia phage Tardus TaxID=2939734 RepID=A0A9E7J818_9CAUD|nr:hypothetical protein SEA_TARDUS_63 [Gordonia phage Tardus]
MITGRRWRGRLMRMWHDCNLPPAHYDGWVCDHCGTVWLSGWQQGETFDTWNRFTPPTRWLWPKRSSTRTWQARTVHRWPFR